MSTRIELQWTKIDHLTLKDAILKSRGVYIFSLKANGAAFYVGTAEENPFSKRLGDHAKLFASGGRTFLRDIFFNENGGANAWPRGLLSLPRDRNEYYKRVFVPDRAVRDKPVLEESLRFWRDVIEVYVAPVDQPPEVVRALECRIQTMLKQAYSTQFGIPSRAFEIPGCSSYFLGKEESDDLPLKLSVGWRLDQFLRVR